MDLYIANKITVSNHAYDIMNLTPILMGVAHRQDPCTLLCVDSQLI